MASSRSPIFPMPEAQQHYSDYGFDPQIDYFQVLEEARRHGKRSASSSAATDPRSPDALHFKLRKPISKDDRAAKSKKRRKWWWKAALLFWRRDAGAEETVVGVAPSGSYPRRPSVVSGPVYMTESYGNGSSSTPCRSSERRQVSGPLRAAEVGMAGTPYLSLKELNLMEEGGGGGRRISASSPPLMPIYLVT